MEMKTFLYLQDDNEKEDNIIKALIDTGADLIELDDGRREPCIRQRLKISRIIFIFHVKVYEGYLVFDINM